MMMTRNEMKAAGWPEECINAMLKLHEDVDDMLRSQRGPSQAMKMGHRQIAQAKMRGDWRGNAY